MAILLLCACSTQSDAPKTTKQALFQIQGTIDWMDSSWDHDGDGRNDIVLHKRRTQGARGQLEVVSGRDGSSLSVVAVLDEQGSQGSAWPGQVCWDVGGDINGDGVADWLLGFPGHDGVHQMSGLVRALSGVDGSVLIELAGEQPFDEFGSSLALLGDLDGDGRSEYAIGARQVDPAKAKALAEDMMIDAERGADLVQAYQRYLGSRSDSAGYVSLRSGLDGREIWRATGQTIGHGFGARVQALADLDGDGLQDVLVQCERQSQEPVRVLSAADGSTFASFATKAGPTGPAGDFNGDGVPDVFVDEQTIDSTSRVGGTTLFSGDHGRLLAYFSYPDSWGDYGLTMSVGDLDGDGYDDLALGEPNFNLRENLLPAFVTPWCELDRIALSKAVQLPSEPRSMSYESGCVLIYSGRTSEVLAGYWGQRGQQEGLGFYVCPLPDVSGDGFPDLAISGGRQAFVFEGPGR